MSGLVTAERGLLTVAGAAEQRTARGTQATGCQKREHPSAFLTRLGKQPPMSGGIDPEAEQNQPQVVSLFVDQAAPGTNNYSTEHFPGWQGISMEEVTSIATFAYN